MAFAQGPKETEGSLAPDAHERGGNECARSASRPDNHMGVAATTLRDRWVSVCAAEAWLGLARRRAESPPGSSPSCRVDLESQPPRASTPGAADGPWRDPTRAQPANPSLRRVPRRAPDACDDAGVGRRQPCRMVCERERCSEISPSQQGARTRGFCAPVGGCGATWHARCSIRADEERTGRCCRHLQISEVRAPR